MPMPVLGERWRRDHRNQWFDVTIITMVGSVVVGFGVAGRTTTMVPEL